MQRLLAQGFWPIGELTGDPDLVQVWPEEHRVALEGTNSRSMDSDGFDWLVRSPWPEIGLTEVLALVFGWVERDPDCRDGEVRLRRAAEALAWTHQQALARRAGG